MKPSSGLCAGQVIVEKEFPTESEAHAWMEKVEAMLRESEGRKAPSLAVERHLWVRV